MADMQLECSQQQLVDKLSHWSKKLQASMSFVIKNHLTSSPISIMSLSKIMSTLMQWSLIVDIWGSLNDTTEPLMVSLQYI
jgi:hypothetical protein